jgi:hypothetical protein
MPVAADDSPTLGRLSRSSTRTNPITGAAWTRWTGLSCSLASTWPAFTEAMYLLGRARRDRRATRSVAARAHRQAAVLCRQPTQLPAGHGRNYTVRLYQPRRGILDGTWTFPTIEKLPT